MTFLTVHVPEAKQAEAAEEVYSAIAPCNTKLIETVGRSFFELYELPHVSEKVKENDDCDTEERGVEQLWSANNAGLTQTQEKKSRTKAGVLKLDEGMKKLDLYDLFQVEETANDKDLKKAFRNMSLVYHPDKAKAGEEELMNKKFIQLQEAYDILTNPITRRKYDSSRPFDDSIPEEEHIKQIMEPYLILEKTLKENPNNILDSFSENIIKECNRKFYEEFFPVFHRNAKWSTKNKVPDLPDFGGEGLPEGSKERDLYLKRVYDFYAFWTSEWDSWRDFDGKILEEEGEDALDDPNKAEYREEKRSIERENARIRQKYRNNESARILKLAEMAEKYDSRMRKYRELQWQKKNAGKLEKQRAIEAKKEAEKLAAQEAEKKLKEEEEKKILDKKAKEDEKNLLKNTRRDIRNLRKDNAKTVDQEQFQEFLVSSFTKNETIDLLENMKKIIEDKKSLDNFIFDLMKSKGISNPIIVDPNTITTIHNEETPKNNGSNNTSNTGAVNNKKDNTSNTGAVNNKKSKKNNKKGKALETAEALAAEEIKEKQIDAVEDLLIKEQQMKKSEAKKKQALQKQKLELDRKKQLDALEKKAEEKEKKEKEKEEKKKEEEKLRNEEMRKKHQEESAAAKKKEEEAKMNDIWTFQMSKHREEQLAQLEKICKGDNVVTQVKSALEEQLTKELLDAFAHAHIYIIKDDLNDLEDIKLDTMAVLISKFTNLHFFEIAKRPSEIMSNLKIANSLRNKLKKTRENLRKVLKAIMPTDIVEDKKNPYVCQEGFKSILQKREFPEEGWVQDWNRKNSSKKITEGVSKKKKKGGPKTEEEDLDALFAEFGVQEN